MKIELRDVHVRGRVRAIDLAIASGERVALLGPSGAGKSTVLRAINGLVTPSQGTVLVDDRPLAEHDLVALRRRMGWVIQDGALFPHLDVAGNVAFVPSLLGWPAPRTAARVDEALTLVGLTPEKFRARMPRSLSGGERQRVGVARAIAGGPELVLLDEPFAALDPLLRGELRQDLARVITRTMVLVTHDVVEALTMATRIVLLQDGAIVLDVPRGDFTRAPHPLATAYMATARAAAEVVA